MQNATVTTVTKETKAPLIADLQARATLVSLPISVWTGTITDKDATNETLANHQAMQGMAKTRKNLVQKQALAPIITARGNAKTYFYSRTLPWSDNGFRILPTAEFFEFTAQITRMKDEFNCAVSRFLASYSEEREQARALLGSLYKDSDYPDVDRLSNQFSFDVKFLPIPSASDFRVNLPDSALREMRQSTEASIASATMDAQRDLWRRLADPLKSLFAAMSDPEARFTSTKLSNVVDVAALVPNLNLSDDEELNALATAASELVSRFTCDGVKESKSDRAKLADGAKEILAKFSAYGFE